MICRINYKDVRKFLEYEREVRQLSVKTINRKRSALYDFLEWAGSDPLTRCQDKRPTFPAYLEDVEVIRNYRPTGQNLSYRTRAKVCSAARQFLEWAAKALPERYGEIDLTLWINSLRAREYVQRYSEPEKYTIGEVLKLVAVPGDSLRMRRERAAVAFIFLSGMRVGAFTTLPIVAVNLDALEVRQWPQLGVQTKNGDAATTYLLKVSGLLSIVREWDEFVRNELSSDALWYPRLTSRGRSLDYVRIHASNSRNRRQTISTALKDLCKGAEIPYRSAHKLRHGHAALIAEFATGISEYKALSQNLMHADLMTTDAIYNVLCSDQVRTTIDAISERIQPGSAGSSSVSYDSLREMLLRGDEDASLVSLLLSRLSFILGIEFDGSSTISELFAILAKRLASGN
jgi:site-specific recombinase XerD